MNICKYFLIIIIFCNFSVVKSEEIIAYLDMQMVYKNSLAGKALQLDLIKIKNKLIKDIQANEKILKKQEAEILSQKNILPKNEYENKISKLKKDIEEYKISILENENILKNKQFEANSLLLEQLTPMVIEYSKKNSISILMDKKNIIIGKTSLDITEAIVKLLNKKIKKIDLIN